MGDVLTLTHTTEAGTLLEGTDGKHEASYDVLKANGWRWSSRIDCWYVPRSRGQLPQHWRIERTTTELQQAGYDVEVSVDATPADPAALEQAKRERAEQRAQGLARKASAKREASDRYWDSSDASARHFPLGQPVLVGHHSEARHRREQQRMDDLAHKAIAADNEAAELERKARAAAAAAQPVSKVTLGNRIETLAAEVRKGSTLLDRCAPGTPSAERVAEQLAHDIAKLNHARKEWDERVATGEFIVYSPGQVKAGDLVKINGRWAKVARANPKSCSVETGYSWTDRVPWHKITDHKSNQTR